MCVRPKNERIFEYLQSTNKWLSRAPLFRSVANGSNGFKMLYIAYVHTSIMCPSEQSVSVFHIFCHFSSICTYSFLCILYHIICVSNCFTVYGFFMVSLYFLDTHIRSVFISKTHNVVKECMLSNYPFYSTKASVLNAFDSCMP